MVTKPHLNTNIEADVSITACCSRRPFIRDSLRRSRFYLIIFLGEAGNLDDFYYSVDSNEKLVLVLHGLCDFLLRNVPGKAFHNL